MRVIHDAHDVPIDYFDASDRIRRPLVPVLAQHYDCQLAVHFCNCQSPRHALSFVVPEVWRFADGTGKAICDAESSIRANKFAEPRPITLIESGLIAAVSASTRTPRLRRKSMHRLCAIRNSHGARGRLSSY